MMKHEANLIEIFSSLQGEGPHVGEAMTFVRFEKCSFGCHYCDTPESFKKHKTFRVETPSRSELFRDEPNPINVVRLNEIITEFDDTTISVTGGEPLEQAEFLSQWLPTQHGKRKILLETNGIHPRELKLLLPSLDIISMDIKLESSSGLKKSSWKEHDEFLRMANASGKELYIKMVLTGKTTDRDIERAIQLVNSINRFIPVILQPVTPTLTFTENISDDRLASIERTCQAYLPDVRIIPQMQKEWGVL